ncbi:MAG: class I SAM-dependent methyltransferase [Planctomycetaceae bacterium]|nr:class I SAM-dependent methyltransferase [Planctomycetaceae bacterium]
MEVATIQRQYDDVIASQYDLDPQSITSNSLDIAISHMIAEGLLSNILPAMRILDVGMGTGMFLEKLRHCSSRPIEPYGIDISARMVEIAQRKLPDLIAAVDDGANIDRHFCDGTFHLASTHFVTGFVPISHLAPRIFRKLEDGGYWSFVGGTSLGYAELQRRANHPVIRMLFGGRSPDLQGMICPDGEESVKSVIQEAGFDIVDSQTHQPELKFSGFDEFMEYAYHGGWLTPFIEQIGLQNAKRWQQTVLNKLVFPVVDHHNIVLVLARKRGPAHPLPC